MTVILQLSFIHAGCACLNCFHTFLNFTSCFCHLRKGIFCGRKHPEDTTSSPTQVNSQSRQTNIIEQITSRQNAVEYLFPKTLSKMVTITPVDENNKDIFDIETLLGPTLIKTVEGSPVPTAKEALKSNKSGMVALYFSASWCPPCQRFTPILIDFYNAAKEADCGFDIVFVSSDRGQEEFEGYVSRRHLDMPRASKIFVN